MQEYEIVNNPQQSGQIRYKFSKLNFFLYNTFPFRAFIVFLLIYFPCTSVHHFSSYSPCISHIFLLLPGDFSCRVFLHSLINFILYSPSLSLSSITSYFSILPVFLLLSHAHLFLFLVIFLTVLIFIILLRK